MYDTAAEREAFFKPLVQYRLERVLGEGAFGLAILAHHEIEQRFKVFKLPKHPKTIEALKMEGANLVKLRDLLHPNIIQLHEFGKVVIQWEGKAEERFYLILAFGGTSLRAHLGDVQVGFDSDGNPCYRGSGKRLPLMEGLRISVDICQALEAAHGFKDPQVRMIHRDIKPENILIDDKTGVARLTDFGIARVIDRSSGIASVAGTLLYMDPQCFKGHAGTFSDIYSTGIVMYEMLTGALPFENFEARLQHKPRDPRELNPEIPEEVSRIILRALEPDPADRFAMATEMLVELRKVVACLNPLPSRYVKPEPLGSNRFLCEDTQTKQHVLVQLIESNVQEAEIQDQIAVLDALMPGRIIGPIGQFRNEHILGLVWPAPEGEGVAQALGAGKIISVEHLARVCQAVAESCDLLGKAHENGVVHGQLSPDCIRCSSQNPLSIHGFGAAPALAWHRGRRGAAGPAGLAGFVSPQLAVGNAAPAQVDDIFAMGAVLYLMLTGRKLTEVQVAEQAPASAMEPAPSPPLRSAGGLVTCRLEGVVQKALASQPQDRFQSMAQLAGALRQCRWPEDVVESLVADARQAYEAGQVVEAYEMLDAAQDADPGNAQVHYARGLTYFLENEPRWAIGELQAACAVSPSREAFLFLGQCYGRLSNHEKAVVALERCLEFGEDAQTVDLLARALHALGQDERAVRKMQRAAELEKDPTLARRRLEQVDQWGESRSGSGADLDETLTEPDDKK